MKQISENSTHINYLDYFQGKQVRISKSKATGEIFFNSDDVAKALGYKDHNDMMADPKVQAKVLENQLTGGKPMFVEREETNNIN